MSSLLFSLSISSKDLILMESLYKQTIPFNVGRPRKCTSLVIEVSEFFVCGSDLKALADVFPVVANMSECIPKVD
jgi:hypothetical protein